MKIYWTSGTDIDCGDTGPPCPSPSFVDTSPESPGNVRVCTATDIRCGNPETIYWRERTSGSIKFTDAINPGVGVAVVTGLSDPVGLSIGRNKIYWTDATTQKIGRAELIGLNLNKNASFVNEVTDSFGIDIGFSGTGTPQTMLWTLAGAEKIRRRAIGGGGNGSDFGDFNLGNVTGIRVIFPPAPIPAISTWGWVVMMLLVLAGGTIAILRRRTAAS